MLYPPGSKMRKNKTEQLTTVNTGQHLDCLTRIAVTKLQVLHEKSKNGIGTFPLITPLKYRETDKCPTVIR